MFCNMQMKYNMFSSSTVAKTKTLWVGFTFGFDCIFEASGELKEKYQK